MKLIKNSIRFFNSNKTYQKIPKEIDKLAQMWKTIYNKSLNIKYTVEYEQIFRTPSSFSITDLPETIQLFISNCKKWQTTIFTFYVKNIKVDINFINPNKTIKNYTEILQNIIAWCLMLQNFTNQTCTDSLSVFFYEIPIIKQIPKNNEKMDDNISNTAFTHSCKKSDNTEIIIYRTEEAFKVFIHETMHTFGLDFSNINTNITYEFMYNYFQVKSKFNMFETYTELWARIIHSIIVSFHTQTNFSNIWDIECDFSCFQAQKVFDLNNIDFEKFIENNQTNGYDEDTNNLSYYIFTTILMHNLYLFIDWCKLNNDNLIQFKQNTDNILNFCEFIVDLCYDDYIVDILMDRRNIRNDFINKTMRMTIFELEFN